MRPTSSKSARIVPMSIDFLIVGGGIGGAVLANLLGRRGQRVLVLQKARVPAQQTRPEVLWPATVEVLRTLIPEKLEQRWLLPIRSGVLSCGTQELLRFGPDVFDAAGVQPYSTANTRELLLQQAPCEHQRGAGKGHGASCKIIHAGPCINKKSSTNCASHRLEHVFHTELKNSGIDAGGGDLAERRSQLRQARSRRS